MQANQNVNKISAAELSVLRSQTPGSAEYIHFNNAGASLSTYEVLETVVDYLGEEAMRGGYETEARHAALLSNVYTELAGLINAEVDEVAVFENASAAWGTAFKGIDFRPGDEVIACEMEYVANLIGLADVQQLGVQVRVVPLDSAGNFDLTALENLITDNTMMILVTHISSSGGGVMPVEEIGRIASRHGILYMLDACQSVGQLPLDVKTIKCDILSATGRKYLRAPRGTGFLYVRKEVQDRITPVLLDFQAAGNVSLEGYTLRQDARRFELYEKNRALVLGLGRAVSYAREIGLERIWERIQYLAGILREELSKIDGVTVHDRAEVLSGIVTFSVKGSDAALIKSGLVERKINVSVGGAQATPIYMERQKLQQLVRASVHYYNTEEEIGIMVAVLRELVNQ